MPSEAVAVDFAVWLKAPKERTAAYFSTYSAISRAIQAALRQWVREWFYANPAVLRRYHTAYQILVYFCTHPFRGQPTNTFTYDIQQTHMVGRAFASATDKLERALKAIDTTGLPWEIRERYFPYRYKEVTRYVTANHRALYQMLNVDTMLMDAVLKFAIIDIPGVGLEEATVKVRSAFAVQLKRFSDEFDLSGQTEELLRIATFELTKTLSDKSAKM